VWLTAALLAVNLTACCRELCPATGASTGPDTRPQRHPAKALRNLLFCIPLRIVRTGRRLVLRPPTGLRRGSVLQEALAAIHTLGP
jgi:hypothetical protein